MYDFYCPKCKRMCDAHEEIELREVGFGDDFEEFHIECDTQVEKIFKFTKREE